MWTIIRKFFINNGILLVSIILMSSYVVISSSRRHTGYETGSTIRKKVNIRVAEDSWEYFSDYYKIKTGNSLTYDEVTNRLKNKDDTPLNEELPLNELLKNPDRALLRPYWFTGRLTSKVKVSSSISNYAVLETPQGFVRVFYFFDLPPENNGEVVNIKGIILGKPDDKQGDITSIVSTANFTENVK